MDRGESRRTQNILLHNARRVWHRYVLSGDKTPQYSPKIPLLDIPKVERIAGKLDLTAWPMNGIQTVGDLFSDGQIITYEALADVHYLGRGNFITFGAMRQLIRATWNSGNKEPTVAPILHELLNCLQNPINISGTCGSGSPFLDSLLPGLPGGTCEETQDKSTDK
ncbi:hypothetical protein NDU88_001518 [Pleurodeles waltl]|uniref:Uncharacterized protein n=1 Tax=Pleurodeles waltl TaxID=8319 RepID=A0AAV7TJ32_PLEWA|nr:hypothetical protein NDU88_001518 [Pleurodeles waltl]